MSYGLILSITSIVSIVSIKNFSNFSKKYLHSVFDIVKIFSVLDEYKT
jgi:hypothetical protein